MTILIDVSQVFEILDEVNGIFGVTFVKRTNGEIRDMTCRKGVTKYLKGGELKFNPRAKNLLPVFDVKKSAYRSISVDGVTEIRANGKVYKVTDKTIG